MFDTPILFLIFNRQESARRVFEEIRKVQPKQLFIAADGPRDGWPGEYEKCESTRKAVLEGIDWNCEVKTFLREKNVGLKIAEIEAFTWFFENVEEGIILEDDTCPDQSFFPYCVELLERYRHDERVMVISGSNLTGVPWKQEKQSYFWGLGHYWGWASWRRAWKLYDVDMIGWEDEEMRERLQDAIGNHRLYEFFLPMFEMSYDGRLNSWDLQWLYTIMTRGGLSACPAVNLVANIGFGEDSTNTKNSEDPIAKLATESLSFPLRHPQHRVVDGNFLKLLGEKLNPVPIIIKPTNVERYIKYPLRKLFFTINGKRAVRSLLGARGSGFITRFLFSQK